MGTFARGQIIFAPVAYSDGSGGKLRPALVIATPTGADPLICVITSQERGDAYDVLLAPSDFEHGNLGRSSYVRVCRVQHIAAERIVNVAGTLKADKMNDITDRVVALLRN